MSATEYEDIAALIAAHKARLHQLQLRQAQMGTSTPDYVPVEIAQTTREIEKLSGKPVEMTVREKYLIDEQWRMRYEGDLYKLERKIDTVIGQFHELLTVLAIRGLTPQPRPRQQRRANGE